MSYVAELQLVNWGPFRGKHKLTLDPGVYAVVARTDDDELRSNWQGKTYLLQAMRFALFGKRPKAALTEDDWITRGEPAGGVRLVLSDGFTIERQRPRGKSTQLTAWSAGQKVANQDFAQELIERWIGLGLNDFDSSCFFGQKHIDQIITLEPTDRTDMVNSWIELEPLQVAHEYVAAKLNKVVAELERLVQREGVIVELRQRALTAVGIIPPYDLSTLDATVAQAIEDAGADLLKAEAEEQEADKAFGAANDHAELAVDYDELVARGIELKHRLDEMPSVQVKLTEAERALECVVGERALRVSKVDEVSKLATYGFDGRCPVMDAVCPVGVTVREAVDDQKQRLKIVNADLVLAREAVEQWDDEVDRLRGEVAARDELDAELTKLRELARKIKFQGKRDAGALTVQQARDNLTIARQDVANKAVQVRSLEQVAKSVDEWAQESAIAQIQRTKLMEQVETQREGMAVLGRNGAQRDIASEVLEHIEADANRLLVDSSVPLSVSVKWGREARGLASACDRCGEPYPPSQRPKQCGKCAAPRPSKLVERLDVLLSDRSGAADDLGGIALQLAAAAWLRRKRQAVWGAAFIDEAFGALDERLRPQLAAHLVTMLGLEFGFEQAFLVAHTRDVTEAMPRRLLVTGSDNGSRVEVV